MKLELKLELKKIIIAVVCVYILAYTLMVIYFYQNQREIIFNPKPRTSEEIRYFATEEDYSVMTYATQDALELTYLLREPDIGKPIIIFFNGNAATVESAHEALDSFVDQGYGAVINIYRGYGANSGEANEENFFNDSQIVYNLIKSTFPQHDIILWGYSLGSAVAVHLASNNEIKALVIESGLSSVRDIAKSRYPFLPVDLLLEDEFLSTEYIQDVKASILMIHGKKDDVVDIKYAEKLAKIKELKLLIYKNGNHSNLKSLGAYDDVLKWLDELKE